MARITLKPCKIRSGRVVRTSAPLQEYDWKSLRSFMSPTGSDSDHRLLRSVVTKSYVGRVKRPDRTKVFVVYNPDKSNRIQWLLDKDPLFEEGLVDIYEVQFVEWDGTVTEYGTEETTNAR